MKISFIVAGLLALVLAFWLGVLMNQHTKHDCQACFFAIYDDLARDGARVRVDRWGVLSIRQMGGCIIDMRGFSRPIDSGTLAPGESVPLQIYPDSLMGVACDTLVTN